MVVIIVVVITVDVLPLVVLVVAVAFTVADDTSFFRTKTTVVKIKLITTINILMIIAVIIHNSRFFANDCTPEKD